MAGVPLKDVQDFKTGQYPGICGYDYLDRRGPSGSLQRLPLGYCASEYSLTGFNDEQLQRNTALVAEIARLRRELGLALNQVLSETRREAAHKQAALDEKSTFGKALSYLEALDGAWESIEEMGKLVYDIALQVAPRVNPFTGARMAAEDAKRMHAFVESTRQKVQGLDISRRDLEVFFLVVTDHALHEQLLKFAGDYFDAMHSVDKVRMLASFAPDLILILLTGGIGLAVSAGSKLRHLNRIRGLLLKLGDLLRKTVGRMKTPRKKRLGSGDGSTGSSAGAQTPSQLRKPASANSNGKPDKAHGSSSEGNEGKIDGAKTAKLSQKDIDFAKSTGNTAKHVATRKKLASDFYEKQGMPKAKIEGHTAGIDFEKPVEVVEFPKDKVLHQYQVPAGPQGNYYTESGIKPSSVGISNKAKDWNTGEIVERQVNTYKTNNNIKVLKSSAKEIDDTWSIPGKTIPTEGGGTQYFTMDGRSISGN